MNKIYVAILLFFATLDVEYCLARSSRHELGMGIGYMSRPFIKDAMRMGMEGFNDDYSYSGTFHAYYQYALNADLCVGAIMIYEQQIHRHGRTSPPFDNYRDIYEDRYYTFLFSANYFWINNRIVSIYTNAALGLSTMTSRHTINERNGPLQPNETISKPAYQFTCFGVRAGRKLGIYAEVGYGYKGIFVAGLNYRF